ncbi:MAG TPA: 6-phosphogluconolactonase [Candidatus Saccharimonadales bacterium]|nr:6-phosphogluconolactonase [Candidatus Saccharimonadales bacterium]
MKFIRTAGWEEGTKALGKRLVKELQSKQVLWLVCGGSNIAAAVQVMQSLPDELTEHLSIFLTDERFGEIGHRHSNAAQLLDAGFQTKQAVFVPVLQPGFSLSETQERYGQALASAVEHADIVIGQFGIGPDGHIAGILPHSPATTADGWMAAYEAPPYTRVTMTFPALRHIDVAFAMAFGDDKRGALSRLETEELPLDTQPSQILKELPEAYVYNDQVGKESKTGKEPA